jgi:hypothetical protein
MIQSPKKAYQGFRNIQDSLRNCGTSTYPCLVSKNIVFLLPVKNTLNILIQNGTSITYTFSFKIRRLVTSLFQRVLSVNGVTGYRLNDLGSIPSRNCFLHHHFWSALKGVSFDQTTYFLRYALFSFQV